MSPTKNEWEQDDFASDLHGFGPLGIISLLLIVISGNVILPGMILIPVGAILTLLWVHLTNTPWQNIGFIIPGSWSFTLVVGLLVGTILKFITKAIILPLTGADPINHAYHFLVSNTTILPLAIVSMVVAGFAEEIVFRGFLFERLGKLFGTGTIAKILILIITTIVFALGHLYDQGITGVEQALLTGLVFGGMYLITRNLWPVMIAHAAFDITALFIIYSNLEIKVAHLFFN
jgi:membrane protease YdiL (CAAX protease family)